MTTRPTPDDLAKWRALADAATPGEWRADGEDTDVIYMHLSDGCCIDIYDANRLTNAAFIAAAREMVPRLLDEVERLRAEAECQRYEVERSLEGLEEVIGLGCGGNIGAAARNIRARVRLALEER